MHLSVLGFSHRLSTRVLAYIAPIIFNPCLIRLFWITIQHQIYFSHSQCWRTVGYSFTSSLCLGVTCISKKSLSVIAPLLVSVLCAYCLYLCQCSCQQMMRTRCCGGSREQTSSWRRWNKGTSSENAGRKSAIMKKPGRRLRMTKKRWVWVRCNLMFLLELEHKVLSVITCHGISSWQEVSIIDRKRLSGYTFSQDG